MEVNNTRLITHPSFGNGLTPTKDIDSGTLLLSITSPLLILVEQSSLQKTCSYCFFSPPDTTNVDKLKHCAACKIPHYCSSQCQKADWSLIHGKECKILKKLPRCPPTPVRALMQMLLLRQRTGEMKDEAWIGLEGHVEKFRRGEGGRGRWEEFLLQARGAVEFSGVKVEGLEMAVGLLCRMATNAFRVTLPDDTPVGLCFSPHLALVNHSCFPNAAIIFSGRTVTLRSLTKIKAGEQIFISYIDPLQPRETRRTELRERYFFTCECDICGGDENPYQTFLRLGASTKNEKKEDDAFSLWWDTAKHLSEAKDLTSTAKNINLHTLLFTKAQSLIDESRASETPKEQLTLLTTALALLKPLTIHNLYAIPPLPTLLNELYLNHLSISSYITSLTILLFTSLHLDPYTYPTPYHPIRTVRLYTIAKLMKHIASLPTSSLLPSPSIPFTLDQQDRIRNIDYISAMQVFLIFARELGGKSHGVGGRFMEEVEGELRDLEEMQRGRGDGRVGVELRRWMVQGDVAVEGKLLVETLLGGLRELVEMIGRAVPRLEVKGVLEKEGI